MWHPIGSGRSEAPMNIRIALFVITTVQSVMVAGSHLKADGLLRVVSVDRATVRLTLIPEFSEARVVVHKGGRFELDLPYHAHYVLRAEAPGCATKEIIFDVNVPRSMDREERAFPLEILMEKMPQNERYHYAGPVGLVFFDTSMEEFVYSTDHRRIQDRSTLVTTMHRNGNIPDDGAWAEGTGAYRPIGDPLAERLDELVTGIPTAVPVGGSASNTLGVHAANADSDTPSVEEPTEASRPASSSSRGTDDVPPAPEAQVRPTQAAVRLNDPLDAGSAPRARTIVQQVGTATRAAERSVVRSASMIERPTLAECGTTEQQYLPRCVLTIHRIPNGTGCMELRKAVHAYGATFYFHDGGAITGPLYLELLRRRGRE